MKEEDRKVLNEAINQVASKMKRLPSDIRVPICIIDDKPECIEGLIETLNKWPGLEVKFYHHTGGVPFVENYFSLILLDHDLVDIKGDQLLPFLSSENRLIASITTNENPGYGEAHFSQKWNMTVGIRKTVTTAIEDFVRFMNELLDKLIPSLSMEPNRASLHFTSSQEQ